MTPAKCTGVHGRVRVILLAVWLGDEVVWVSISAGMRRECLLLLIEGRRKLGLI
jgi:hypothetical protein